VLDQLEELFLAEGFSGVSVRELAANVGCSRRTLYELAPSKDELVLVVLDRFLHRVGRSALDAIDPNATYAEQIRTYFLGGLEFQRANQVFADDLADEPAARQLFDRHFRFAMVVVENLVVQGIAAGEFRAVTPGVVAGILAGSALYISEPDVIAGIGIPAETATGEIADLLIRAISRSDAS
jgi:AcrR family transcriptional regulator